MEKIRVAYFGFDFFASCLKYLVLSPKFELEYVFTGAGYYATQIRNICKIYKVPTLVSEPYPEQVRQIFSEVDLVLSASYSYKIPCTTEARYAINIHPTLLPKGRGPSPIPWILNFYPDTAGITFHKMTDDFDAGDIIATCPISLSEQENFETYAFKASKTALSLLEQVTNDLVNIWEGALPQDKNVASYWNKMQEKQRTISLNLPGEKIVRLIKSLGSQGAILEIDSRKYLVKDCSFIQDVKIDTHLENIFVYENDFFISAKCADGYIVIPRRHTERL